MNDYEIKIFSTCPQYPEADKAEYVDSIRKVSRWSEDCDCRGILIYADNRQLDPWLVSQEIIASTESLSPLVAVQPVYMHPYTVAKMVATLGNIYNRKLYLNMVAGGFKNDLNALNDSTPHDDRYERLKEYTTIITELLKGEKPVTFKGEYYRVNNLTLDTPIDESLFPGIFVSGSSEAGLKAARELQATAIQYPQPVHEYKENLEKDELDYGIRIGIIARNEEDEAWKAGFKQFPADRAGQLAHELAVKTTDSVWYKKLAGINDGKEPSKGADQESRVAAPSGRTAAPSSATSAYWLHPFKNYKTMCPYLVGNYYNVARHLSRYMEIGYRTFILDIPPNRDELIHIYRVFEMAKEEMKV